MNCEQAQPQLAGQSLGDLPPRDCREVTEHVSTCRRCRASLRQIELTLDLLRDALAASLPSLSLTAAQRRRVIRRSQPGYRRAFLWRYTLPPAMGALAAVLVVGCLLLGLMMPAFRTASMSASHLREDMMVAGPAPERASAEYSALSVTHDALIAETLEEMPAGAAEPSPPPALEPEPVRGVERYNRAGGVPAAPKKALKAGAAIFWAPILP